MMGYLKEDRPKVFWDSTISSLVRAVGIISTFILIKSVDENLDDDELGYLLTALSLFSFLALFDLGLGNASRNLISSEYFSGKKSGLFEAYLTLNTLLVGLVFVVGGQIFLMTYQGGWLTTVLDRENICYLIIAALCQPGRIGYLSVSQTYAAQIIQYLPIILVTFISSLFAADFEFLCKLYLRFLCSFNLLGVLLVFKLLKFDFKLIAVVKLITSKIFTKAFSYLVIQSLGTATFIMLNLWVIESVSAEEGLSFNLMFRVYSAGLAIFGAYILPNWTQIQISTLSFRMLIKTYIYSQRNTLIIFIFGGLLIGLMGNKILSLLVKDFKDLGGISWVLIFTYYCIQLLVQELGTMLNGLGMTRIQVIFGIIQIIFLAAVTVFLEGTNLFQALLILVIFSLVPLIGSIIYLYKQYVRDFNSNI
ncbi:hypothetical protein N9B14_00900 [Akkermansiaceae bacterium]|nr:hypothetical protein [Akkermansiaceae bacterium]